MKSYKYYGFFRAKVVNNNDPDKFGRVLIWVPDIMPEIPDDEGIWARPGNNPIGGRNSETGKDNNYAGTSYIPLNGSWIWIFFENGNINRPYYFGALDLQNAKVLPENQLGNEPYNKWVIFKSHEGRTVVVSDDSDDARVEITGKKRQIKSPPSGDTDSVYTIDDNQTTILFDERDGKEKVLIRTHKGDFFHIDIDEQKLQGFFKNGIILKTDGDFQVMAENIDLKVNTDLNLEATKSINLKSIGEINLDSIDNLNLNASGEVAIEGVSSVDVKSSGTLNEQSVLPLSLQSATVVAIDAPLISENGGLSSPASSAGTAGSANEADPKGSRDT